MWPTLTLNDIKVVGHYLGYLVVFIGALMVIPIVIAVVMGDTPIVINYLLGMGLCLLTGFLLCMFKVTPTVLKRKQAVVITALAWLVCSLLAAIPLYLSGHWATYFDSLFEAMSGFTTSGFTMCLDIEHMSPADNMWRFLMHFVGGQGVVVIALSFGLFARASSRGALYDAEGRHDHVMPEVRQTAIFIFRLSIIIIAIGSLFMTLLLLVKGLSGTDALFNGICITIAAYDTAGFSTTSLGIPYYHSWTLEIVCMLIMMLGAISFTLYSRLRKGMVREFFRNFELRTYAVWIVAVVVIVVATMGIKGYMGDTDTLLRKGLFTVISAATSTGSQVIAPEQMAQLLSAGSVIMIGIAMVIGGMTESMAGGIKVLRIGIIAKEIKLRIKQVLLPDSARVSMSYEYAGRKVISQGAVGTALVTTTLFVTSIIVGAIAAMAMGYEAVPAIFDSMSASANNGLTTGLISPVCPFGLKFIYFLQMWFGRLEFITVLSCIAAVIASIGIRGKRGRKR